jgi:hypothetical protein
MLCFVPGIAGQTGSNLLRGTRAIQRRERQQMRSDDKECYEVRISRHCSKLEAAVERSTPYMVSLP